MKVPLIENNRAYAGDREVLMTTALVTFCDSNMTRAAELCVGSAAVHGVNTHFLYTPEILQSRDIVKANPEVFSQPADPRRAWGWWAFKPLIIGEAMESVSDGDVIVYSDAGVKFIDNVNYIIDRMSPIQDIWLFGNMYEHAHWCKRDIIDAIWPTTTGDLRGLSQDGSFHSAWRRYGKQVQASVIFFRVNDKTRAFVKEWLDWCLMRVGRQLIQGEPGIETRYLIDDSPSFAPNHPEFRENRHDQAILTTLAYREGIPLHWWPAIYNDGAFTYERGDYPDEGYPPLFHHHRRRNHEFTQSVRYESLTKEQAQGLEDHFNASRGPVRE